MQGLNIIHKPITWTDFLENSGHHTARFLAEGRRDTIPVYLGDGGKNPFACVLMSLPAFRVLSPTADERLLEFWLRLHDESDDSAIVYGQKRSGPIPDELAEAILARRKELLAGEIKYAYLYDWGRGFQGVAAIYSAESDMSFLEGATKVLILASYAGDDWYRRMMGLDTRPAEEVRDKYGEIRIC